VWLASLRFASLRSAQQRDKFRVEKDYEAADGLITRVQMLVKTSVLVSDGRLGVVIDDESKLLFVHLVLAGEEGDGEGGRRKRELEGQWRWKKENSNFQLLPKILQATILKDLELRQIHKKTRHFEKADDILARVLKEVREATGGRGGLKLMEEEEEEEEEEERGGEGTMPMTMPPTKKMTRVVWVEGKLDKILKEKKDRKKVKRKRGSRGAKFSTIEEAKIQI